MTITFAKIQNIFILTNKIGYKFSFWVHFLSFVNFGGDSDIIVDQSSEFTYLRHERWPFIIMLCYVYIGLYAFTEPCIFV